MDASWTEAEQRFASAAVRRRGVFLALSVAGVAVAGMLAAWSGWQRWTDPAFPLGLRGVLVVLILLNARQNLRQYRYAGLLEKVRSPRRGPGEPGSGSR